MSLPSLGVVGARPLLESPVELGGLFLLPPVKGLLNGLSGTVVVGVVNFLTAGICADNGTPVTIVTLRWRTCIVDDFKALGRWSVVDVWPPLPLGKFMITADLCCDGPGDAEIDSTVLTPNDDDDDDVATRVELLGRV